MKANKFLTKTDDGYTNLIPMVLAIVIVFALIYIGAFVNGTLSTQLTEGYPAAASRTLLQNTTISTMENLSDNFDSTLDIVQVAVIITVLAAAIGAIFLFTRFR